MHHRRARRRRHPWRGRFFGPGEVRLALLGLLADGPRHGYELMGQLEERSGGVYRASAGTVYPTLQQLEDEGLATSETVEGRRVYRLTEAGEREVESERAHVDRIWQRAEQWSEFAFVRDPDAAEIVRPALRLARAAYRAVARSHGDPDVVDRVRQILDRTREELRAIAREPRRD
ncbi:MAG: PadR family transcriptional regulator [Proteobacteria bacterium]|nr:PadR family transcriptional regulator [Pseudomonadota bacterium]